MADIRNPIPGTAEILGAVTSESGLSARGPMWRPVRAAAIHAMALADAPVDHVFMSNAEFLEYMAVNGLDRRGGIAELAEHLDISAYRRDQLLAGETPTRMEALSCAHYGLRLPLPVEPGDAPAFSAFITDYFGRPHDLARALGVEPDFILERMAGFRNARGERLVRLPKVDLIRAVDWVRRVGPFSPYGDPLPLPSNLTEKF